MLNPLSHVCVVSLHNSCVHHPLCPALPPNKQQGDLLRPLALPALLVGDPKLGGISTTLSAYESLLLRGAHVAAVVMMTEGRYDNVTAVRQHLQHAAAHR